MGRDRSCSRPAGPGYGVGWATLTGSPAGHSTGFRHRRQVCRTLSEPWTGTDGLQVWFGNGFAHLD
jgi:hypothetical protein